MADVPATLAERTVLITGARDGLGLAMSRELLALGACVAMVTRHHLPGGDEPSLQDRARELDPTGHRIFTAEADASNPEQMRAVVASIRDTLGPVNTLINNAGNMGGEAGFLEQDRDVWQRLFQDNLLTAVVCSQTVLPHMLAAGSGIIINVTSGAAVRAGFLNVAYGAAKAALDRLTLGIHHEFADRGIVCLSLSPPASDTPAVRRIYRDTVPWAKPPDLTARALGLLLADRLDRYAGRVVSVREYLEGENGTCPA